MDEKSKGRGKEWCALLMDMARHVMSLWLSNTFMDGCMREMKVKTEDEWNGFSRGGMPV